MRSIVLLTLFLLAGPVAASCFAVLDNGHPCRYPQGDAWCASKGRAPFAYADTCMQSHGPPRANRGAGGGKGVTTAISGDNKFVLIRNLTGEQISWLYVTPTGEPSWEPDRLGDSVIPAGNQFRWSFDWPGCFVDVRVETPSGRKAEQIGVDACGGFTWTLK